MSAETSFQKAIAKMPIVPVLREISPEEVVVVTDILYDAGFRIVEVTLNSPRPYDSITLMVDAFWERMRIGAGTVLAAEEVAAVQSAGGALIVSPDKKPGRHHRNPRANHGLAPRRDNPHGGFFGNSGRRPWPEELSSGNDRARRDQGHVGGAAQEPATLCCGRARNLESYLAAGVTGV